MGRLKMQKRLLRCVVLLFASYVCYRIYLIQADSRDSNTVNLENLVQETKFHLPDGLVKKWAPLENEVIGHRLHNRKLGAQRNIVEVSVSEKHQPFLGPKLQRHSYQQFHFTGENDNAEVFPVHGQQYRDPDDSKSQVQNKSLGQELEEEMKVRRAKFLAEVEKRVEVFDPSLHKNFREKDDHLAFVTAGSDVTWGGLLQFVYSIQYHYPESDIGVFDIGLSVQKREQMEKLCKVTVLDTYMKFWPKHVTNPKLKLWRPIVWQMALAHYGHIVYVEPDRFLMTKSMKEYIEHSRRSGITVVGRRLQYSPFVVTNPEMYYFLPVDLRKLQKLSMFEINMIVLHNSQLVRHHFMRYLAACVLEEYCIAPPGSTFLCDQRLFAGSQKYANCHRYDLSAVNILLDKWFDYKHDLFLVRDIVTAHYDGRDVSKFLKTCDTEAREEI